MAIVSVRNESEIVEAVRAARQTRKDFETAGRGTKRGLGRPVNAVDVLDCSALTGVIDYEPDELLLTCAASTPVAEIEKLLNLNRQRLGFAPPDWGPLYGAPANAATIAGVLSADANGSAAIRYGRARDHLLGYRAVNGFAEAYKGGGKVVKNVTGFDLPKLMCGAFGTLGVLTEVTLRVFPKPPSSTVLAVRDVSPKDGLTLLRRVWSSPLEATGLVFHPQYGALVRLEGAPLAEKIAGLCALIPEHVFEDAADIFGNIESGAAFRETDLPVWRIALPPTQAHVLIETLDPPLWHADWAGGLLWLATDADVHTLAIQFGGRAVLMRADERSRRGAVFPPEDETRMQITRAVKAAFDPLHLFNPGRMVEGL